MSEKKGPFDAAIGMLRGKGIRLFPPTEVQAAIRVLEAAGKVNKSMVLEAEFFWPHNVHVGREFGPCRKAIRALLESLPESGKEEK